MSDVSVTVPSTAVPHVQPNKPKKVREHEPSPSLSKDEKKRVACLIIVCKSTGRALWTQRAASKDHGGEWCVSAGGHIEEGETPEQAAVRESDEELGRDEGFDSFDEFDVEPLFHKDGPDVDFHVFRLDVKTEFEPDCDPREIQAYVWADEPPDPVHPGLIPALRKMGINRAFKDADEVDSENEQEALRAQIADSAQRHLRELLAAHDGWSEEDHPRGQPNNAGQFSSGGGGLLGKVKGLFGKSEPGAPKRDAAAEFSRWEKAVPAPSPEDKSLLSSYVGFDYEGINGILRHGYKPPDVEPSAKTDVGAVREFKYYKKAQALKEYIAKSSFPEDTTLYRGLNGSYADAFLKDSAPGNIFKSDAFVSMTPDSEESGNFARGGGVTMEIDVKKGAKAVPVHGSSETEIIGQAGSRMEIVSVDKKRRVVRVRLLNDDGAQDAWNEGDHPRGQPNNSGQFASSSSSGSKRSNDPEKAWWDTFTPNARVLLEDLTAAQKKPNDAQLRAINKYTGDSYRKWNSHLRGGGELSGDVAALQEYLLDNEFPEDIAVERGVAGSYAASLLKMRKGSVFRDLGFISTAAGSANAFSFGKDAVKIRMNIPKGAKGATVAHYGDPELLHEAEVLLPAGTAFKVRAINGKVLYVDLLPESQTEPREKKKGFFSRLFGRDSWNEEDHPRGQPNNAGQFSSGGGSPMPDSHFIDKGGSAGHVGALKAASRYVPEQHRKFLDDLRVMAADTIGSVMSKKEIEQRGAGSAVGFLSPDGRTIAVVENFSVPGKKLFGFGRGRVKVRTNPEHTFLHEVGHAIDAATGGEFTLRFHGAIQQAASQMSEDEAFNAAYFLDDADEGFAELYAAAFAPNVETFFGGMPRDRVETVFAKPLAALRKSVG